MKICWDNLEDIRYIGKARLRKGKNTYFIKICKYCGEECLCAKISTYCTNNCSNADRIIPWYVANKTLLGFKGLDTRKLLIDNVDLFLERYFSKPVSVVTCTEESR